MNGGIRRQEHGSPPADLRDVHAPLPMHERKGHKPPLEVHAEREPWLPLSEAYPELARGLHAVTVIVVAVLTVLVVALVVVGLLQ